MKIGIASDHRGYKLKNGIINSMKNYEFIDLGTYSEESTDYPLYGIKLGESLINNEFDYGVLICGTGIGISIACNKVKGIRCARITSKEDAMWCRRDNDANVIAFGENTNINNAIEMVNEFINTEFLNEERFIRRKKEITDYEEKNES